MTSEVLYKGGLRTVCTHIKSKEEIITDAPTDNNGKGEAFSPTDLLATSLSACAMTIMGIAANNHEIDIDGTKAEVLKHMASDPRRVSQVDVAFHMPNKTYTNKEKTILEKAALTCPVAKSLHPDIIQNLTFLWND
jgi:putative redox protein